MILRVFKNKTKILFLHIPKTGGTSVKNALLEKFDRSDVQLIYGFENFQPTIEEFASSKKKLAIGHFGWEKKMEVLYDKAFKITFLRHPVARVISHYWHFQRSSHEGDQYLKGMSFEDFLETPFAQNWQTRRLGGGLYDNSLSDQDCFEEALKNVESRFDFVGITERMKESSSQLGKKLSIDIKDVHQENVNPEKKRESEMACEYAEAILEKNKFDLRLFEAGEKRLQSDS